MAGEDSGAGWHPEHAGSHAALGQILLSPAPCVGSRLIKKGKPGRLGGIPARVNINRALGAAGGRSARQELAKSPKSPVPVCISRWPLSPATLQHVGDGNATIPPPLEPVASIQALSPAAEALAEGGLS